MAILTGINTQLSGSAGDWTFAQVGGVTIAKQKVAKKGNAKRTFAQMQNRCRWANLVNLHRAFGGALKCAFEGKGDRVSDYNMFLKANLSVDPVFITRSMANAGSCLVAAYQVSRGSLPSITITADAQGKASTDISLGSLAIGSSTTLADFSRAVVQHNPAFQYGDQISCFVARQSTNSVTGMPEVRVKAYEVTLVLEAEEALLLGIVGADGFSTVEGKLGASAVIEGAIAWVHSRKTSTGILVSTQRLYAHNSLLDTYRTDEAMAAAIQSYGGETQRVFLEPDGNVDANGNDNANVNANQGTTTFTLAVNGTPAEGGTVSGGGSYASGASATLTASPNTGYRFVQWNDGVTTASRTVTVTENKTYTATFATTTSGGGQEQG